MREIKMYCVFHSRDLDGFMSAAIVMLWYEKVYGDLSGLELIGWDYGDPLPVLLPDVPVIMVDISFPIADMKQISRLANGELTWIDHHISAIKEFLLDDDIESEQWLIAELPKMGVSEEMELVGACELAWRHYFPDSEMPEIVRLLGCYDSFRHKGTEESAEVFNFQYAARTYLTDPETCYHALATHVKFDVKDWMRIGSGILSYLKVEARSVYKARVDFQISEYKAAAINRERFNPSSYDIKYHEDGYDLFMCYSRMKDGRWTVSLYNEDGKVDVSVLAKQFGGGGHSRAAGFVANDTSFIDKYYSG